MAFHRVNITLTDRQMKMMMLEANATGLRVGTLIRMLVHDAIADGRAVKHYRAAQLLAKTNAGPTTVDSEGGSTV